VTTPEDLERRLGAGARAWRIDRRLTQAELADRANVSLSALKNLESGAGANVTTLVKVVHALGADDWLDALAPPPAAFDPLALLEQRRQATAARPRQRVRHPRRAP
jgi:transcriptional regulator with XRE-family HTH domain